MRKKKSKWFVRVTTQVKQREVPFTSGDKEFRDFDTSKNPL